MNDPKRWSETNAGADAWEQAILRAELGARAPNGASAVVWSKLAAELGVAGALVGLAADTASSVSAAKASASFGAAGNVVGAGQALATTAATWIAFAKGVGVGILICSGAWSAWRLSATKDEAASQNVPLPAVSVQVEAARPHSSVQRPEAASPAPAPRTSVSSARSLPVPKEEPAPDDRPAAEAAPTSAAFEAPSIDTATSALAEEARLLRGAREQIRQGQLQAAAVSLREARSRHFTSTLSQEREALEIELLARQGQRALASTRARAFLEAHPESPHAARVRSFVNP